MIFNMAKEQQYRSFQRKHPELSWEEIIAYVNIGLDHNFYSCVHQITDPNNSMVLVNKYNQLPKDFIPVDLEVIEPEFNFEGLSLRHEARLAFEVMCKAAIQEDIYLQAISTFRSFPYQEEVYYRKKTPEIGQKEYVTERDKVSARAGHSEHQTGLAVDINDLEQTFEDTPEGKWLAKNSYQYGFVLRYPKDKEWITGYDYEPWHFRYLGISLAKEVYQSRLTYDEFYVRYISLEC